MDSPPFIFHFPGDEHLSCFHLLATVNNGLMNILIPIFLWTSDFISLRHVPGVKLLRLTVTLR